MILTGLFLSLTIALGSAQALKVTYVDGTVEIQAANGWRPLDVGSAVAPDARVRVSDSGTAEFTRGAKHFSIIKDGTYSIADLLKGSAGAGQQGVGVSLAGKLHSVVSGTGQTSTAVGGARGAAQGDNSQNLTWMDDQSSETNATVLALLNKGRYHEAEVEIKKAMDDSQEDQQKQDLQYLLASAYYGEGESARAYRTLLAMTDDPQSTYYPDSLILKAQIYVDNRSYSDGLTVLKPLLSGSSQAQYAQVGYLLAAMCYKGLGDNGSAKSALSSGYALDPQSDTAKQISKMQSE
jgi:tetratricopeptide (TPR) repeat protein